MIDAFVMETMIRFSPEKRQRRRFDMVILRAATFWTDHRSQSAD